MQHFFFLSLCQLSFSFYLTHPHQKTSQPTKQRERERAWVLDMCDKFYCLYTAYKKNQMRCNTCEKNTTYTHAHSHTHAHSSTNPPPTYTKEISKLKVNLSDIYLLQWGPASSPGGRVLSCCGQTCCRTTPATDRRQLSTLISQPTQIKIESMIVTNINHSHK